MSIFKPPGPQPEPDGPTLLVASGGGHLQQLWSLVPRLGLGPDLVWATPRSGLSDDLLRGQKHYVLPYAKPRDWAAAVRLTRQAHGILRECGAARIVSTGASPAPPFFLAGASLGLDLHYIESATRSNGPSLSGRLVEMLPSAHLYTQYPEWAQGRWRYAGSIFDPYSLQDAQPEGGIRSVVVTLGTEDFPFRRAVERLVRLLPRNSEILWQTGHTDVRGLGIRGHKSVPGDEMRAAMAAADVVVCHAGTGSALTAFELGKVPLVLPREARHGEHVDDHQQLTARELRRRGLAVVAGVDDLMPEHFEMTRWSRVVRDEGHQPFPLHEPTETHTTVDLRIPSPRAKGDAPRRPSAGVPVELPGPRSPEQGLAARESRQPSPQSDHVP